MSEMWQQALDLNGGAMIHHATATAVPVEVNEHGVILAGFERWALPHYRRGWQGSPIADIEVAQVPAGWTWATSMWLSQGGCSSPLCLETKWRVEPTREEAFLAAKAHLARDLVNYLERHRPCRESRLMRKWLENMPAPEWVLSPETHELELEDDE